MFPRPHCVCAVCAHTLQCLSVGWRTHVFLLLRQSEGELRETFTKNQKQWSSVCRCYSPPVSQTDATQLTLRVCVCVRVFRPCVFCFFVTTEEENSCPCFLFCCCSRRGRAGERGSAALRLRLFDPTGSGTFTDRLSIDLSHQVGLNRCWCFTAWTGDECCQLLIRTTYENVFVCQSNRLPDSCWWCSCGSDWLICQLISSLIKMIINMCTVKQQQWVFDCRLCYCLLLFKPKKANGKYFYFYFLPC